MRLMLNFFNAALKHNFKEFCKCIFFIILQTIIAILLPNLLKIFLDDLIADYSIALLCQGIILFIILLLVNTYFKIKFNVAMDDFGGKYINSLLLEIQVKINNCDMNDIDELGNNFVKHAMYSDVLDVFRVIGHHVPSMISCIIVICFSIILAFSYNGPISLLLFFSILFGIGISISCRKIIANKSGKTNIKLKALNSLIITYVDSIPLIHTNNID